MSGQRTIGAISEAHMRNVYAKLGAHRRAEAVARARDLGPLAPAAWR